MDRWEETATVGVQAMGCVAQERGLGTVSRLRRDRPREAGRATPSTFDSVTSYL